jgi:GT2 family glycosyltransferase
MNDVRAETTGSSRRDVVLLSVSIIVPCRDEAKYIGSCLDAILENDYPKSHLEIIVVDGMSRDDSVRIVREYMARCPSIRVIQNEKRITPVAFNLGVRAAKGELIMIMSAHAVVARDYISKCVKYSIEYNADNVGGIMQTRAGDSTVFGRAIAHSVSHPFAAGTAVHRTGRGVEQPRWVDTVFGGCFKRAVFDRIGLFDERLAKGQDREFNVRLRRAGGRILCCPDVISYYYARGELGRFFRWMWVVGLTPIYMSRIIGKRAFSGRNLVPALFVLWLAFWLAMGAVGGEAFVVFLASIAFYLTVAVIFSIPIAMKERDARFLGAMPFIFLATHVLYGLGSLAAVVKAVNR